MRVTNQTPTPTDTDTVTARVGRRTPQGHRAVIETENREDGTSLGKSQKGGTGVPAGRIVRGNATSGTSYGSDGVGGHS